MLRRQSTYDSNYNGIQAGSECDKTQDHIICNVSTLQRFGSTKAQCFIWLMLNCTTAQHHSFHYINGTKALN
jgi:hypothetical protein